MEHSRVTDFKKFKKLLEDVNEKARYEGLNKDNFDVWLIFEKLLKFFDTLEHIKENKYLVENLKPAHAILL